MVSVGPAEDVFTLRWNRYEESLSCGLQGLLLAKDLVDVTLVCDEGEFVKAHKVVLAASSTYFRNLFTDNTCKHPTVVMPDIKMSHLHSILEFIYTGEVNVGEKNIMDFLNTSEMLKINGLTLMLQEDLTKDPLQPEDPVTPEPAAVIEVVTTTEPLIDTLNATLKTKISVIRKRRKNLDQAQNCLAKKVKSKRKVKIVEEPLLQLLTEPLEETFIEPVSSQPLAQLLGYPLSVKPLKYLKTTSIPPLPDSSHSETVEPIDPLDVRRSARKRKRSVRAPSPESILRGSRSFHFISQVSSLLHEDDEIMAQTEPEIKTELSESSPEEALLEIIQEEEEQEEPDDEQSSFNPNPTLSVKMERLKCPSNQQDKDALKGLRITTSKVSGRFKCPLCSKTYSYRNHVERHFKLVHKNVTCTAKAQSSKKVGGRTIKLYHCPYCTRKFDRQTFVDRHVNKFHSSDEFCMYPKEEEEETNKFYCPICSKPFDHESSVTRHIAQVHAKKRPKITIVKGSGGSIKRWNCDYCCSTFERRGHFVRHVKKRHGIEIQSFGDYSRPETSSVELPSDGGQDKIAIKKQHVSLKARRTENGGYKCPYCSKTYNYQSHVYRHVNNIHGKFSHSMTCKLCGRVAQNLNSLKSHYFVVHPGNQVVASDYVKTP